MRNSYDIWRHLKFNPLQTLVQNTTGKDLPAQSVLGVNQRGLIQFPPYAPYYTTDATHNQGNFVRQPAFKGVVPSLGQDFGSFVVTAEFIPKGGIGRCYYSGVCAVKVNISAGTGGYCDVTDQDTTALTYHSVGSAQILWQQQGTQPFWCVVRLGNIRTMLLFPVKLTNVSGTGVVGNPYLYNVFDCYNDTQINTPGTPLVPQSDHQDGKVSPATYGSGYYVDGGLPANFKLHTASESLIVTSQSVVTSVNFSAQTTTTATVGVVTP